MSKLLILVAKVLFAIALFFGMAAPYQQLHGSTALHGESYVAQNIAIASNNVAGPASLGFAIAGGLALLAAARAATPKT